MKLFQRGVLRIAMKNRAAVIGTVLIIAIGIFIYVSMFDTLRNLESQVTDYYETNGMADIFAEVSGIPRADLERLTEIDGIRAAGGKAAEDLRILFPGQESIVTVHLMSFDPDARVNVPTLSGPFTGKDDIFLGSRMADYYGFRPGDSLQLLREGHTADVVFRGTVSGPDYIYTIPPGGAMVPDGGVYEAACVSAEKMRELTGSGRLQELGFLLEPGSDFESVRRVLSERLKPYGLKALYERKDQKSWSMVDGELLELISTGTILPILFLAISVFMLYVVMKKMIDRDRSVIGTMKAFGMADRELLTAYLMEGAAVGAAGALLGSLAAGSFGRYMFALYVEFFNLPDTGYHDYLNARAAGLIFAVAASVGAVFIGVRRAIGIAPAEAMRAAEPKSGTNIRFPESMKRKLGAMTRLGLGNAVRNPFRGLLIALAVAFPFSLSSVLFSFMPLVEKVLTQQFTEIQSYDLMLTLDRSVTPQKAEQGALAIDGVSAAEGIFVTSVSIQSGSRTEYARLYGLNRGSGLWRIKDNRGGFYEPPSGGLIIENRAAEKLGVSAGDTVLVSGTGLTAEPVRLRVTSTISEIFGSGCYMDLASFDRVFNTRTPANTVLIRTEKGMTGQVRRRLLDTSRVSWIVDSGKIVKSYRDMVGSMMIMIDLFALMSAAAGGILIYNIAMINLKERFTEIGTMKILGVTDRELGRMMLLEHMIYFAAGILIGIPGSRAVRYLVEKLIINDNYNIPMEIGRAQYAGTFFMCLAMLLIAWYREMRLTARIPLTEILKERE